MITENLSTLKIHKLTQEQYDRELAAGNIDETALYLTPDSGIHIASKTGESPVLNDSAAGGLKIDRICGRSKQETGIITDDKGNEIVIPNPEYPQPIVSVGQKLVDGVVTDVGISKKLTGKNLLKNTAVSQTINGVTFTVNEDGSVTANGTATAFVALSINSVTLSSGDYILSGCPNGGEWNTYSLQIDYDSQETGSGLNIAFSDNKKKNVRIAIYNGTTVSNLVFKPMIRLASIEDDTYEPYTEQTLTLQTPNGLPGIPLGTTIPDVIKNSPIHMSGVYWDNEEGLYHIADTKNENGKDVQRIGKSVVDLSKCNVQTSGVTDDGNYDYFQIIRSYIMPNCSATPMALSNKFVYSYNDAYPSFWFADVRIIFENKISEGVYKFADVESFKNEVGEVEFYYILATPIETPLTDEEIIALHQLKTYQGVTHIFGSNAPDATMIFKYSSSEIGGVTLENSNLHAVNEVLRRRMLTHSDVVDNLASTDTNLPLSANQGRVLKDELNDLKDEIPDVLPINKGGTGATDATTALANLGGVKASETIKTAFYDDAAENIGQLLDAKCAHARELNAPAVCIYGGWQNIDFGVFYAQVVNNVVQGIYVKGDTAYIVRCDSGTDTATYLEVAVQSDIDAIGAGTEITDVTQITQGGMYYSNGNVANAPTNDGVYYEYFASKNGWIVSIIARSGSDGATYVSNNGYDGTIWTNKGWHRLITDEDIPYKVVIDDTAGTINFIDR